MKKFFKTLVMAVLCLALVLPMAPFVGEEVQAAAVKLNKTNVTLILNQSVSLKLTGTTKKPVWTSSNTKVAAVGRSTGKVTAKKIGTASIMAKLGSKSYRCKVTVVPNYQKLYKNFLAANKSKIKWYYVLNVDQSGVPELITAGDVGAYANYEIYTIKNQKVVLAGEYTARGISMSNPTFKYNPKYKCLYSEGWINYIGGAYGNLYGMSGGKLVHKYHAREEHNPKDVYYTGKTDTNCKQVSRATYKKFCEKYFKNVKTYRLKANRV